MAVRIRDDVPQGTARGNGCYACGVGQSVRKGEQWVDFEQNIDFEGWLIICSTCVREAAAMLGMVGPGRAVDAEAELSAVQAEADELLAERNEALALVEALRRYDERKSVPPEDTAELPSPGINADSIASDIRHYSKARAKKSSA